MMQCPHEVVSTTSVGDDDKSPASLYAPSCRAPSVGVDLEVKLEFFTARSVLRSAMAAREERAIQMQVERVLRAQVGGFQTGQTSSLMGLPRFGVGVKMSDIIKGKQLRQFQTGDPFSYRLGTV